MAARAAILIAALLLVCQLAPQAQAVPGDQHTAVDPGSALPSRKMLLFNSHKPQPTKISPPPPARRPHDDDDDDDDRR